MTKLPEPTAIAICYDGTPCSLWHYGDGPSLALELQRQGGTASKLLLYEKQAILDALEESAKVCEGFKTGNSATYIDDDWADMCAEAIRELKEEYK